MDKTPVVFLQHIRDAITHIEEYVSNMTYKQFVSDRKTQDAVIRQLEIIGEATSHLESEFRTATSAIP